MTDSQYAGPIPTVYDRLLVPLLFEPYAHEVAGRVARLTGGRILEIACGTGVVTRALCAAVPQAEIVATDLNCDMLALARDRVASPRVRWQTADVMALPFPAEAFDIAVCQFGVMFFADVEQSFRNVERVLVRGGAYIFTVWRDLLHNDAARLVAEAAAAEFPDDPPNFLARTPYGHDDPVGLEGALQRAGFSEITRETIECRSHVRSGAALAGLVEGTPLRMEIEARASKRLDAVVTAALALGEKQFGAAPTDLRMSAYIFCARKAGREERMAH